METSAPTNFLVDILAADMASGRHGGRVATRFPPEPNGYPHIGHAQSICLNFGLAERFGGTCNLRYDDTNPETESEEFARALEDAVRWLGFDPAAVRYASDDFQQLYDWAAGLIEKGLAYVDSQDGEAIRAGRGTITSAGTPSPYRDRSAEESLRLFEEMCRGEHADGSHVLRAKIDTEHGPMAHPNMKLRDPVMYRIRRDAHHYRTGDAWAVYPLYDWAHGQVDAIEGITHSICTLEFDVNRPLYDWYLDAIGIPEPRNHQYEFARFNLEYTITSKRKLRQLVEDGHVTGWDDPRMPTIAGLRRRGVPAVALRRFFDALGVTKVNGRVDVAQLEHAIRDTLNATAPRRLAVANPLRLTIENLDATLTLDAPLWPHDVTPPNGATLSRELKLSREVWIEQDDFSLAPPKGWKRLAPGASVRLRHGPVITCTGVEKSADGLIASVMATADLSTLDGDGGPRVGVIHWASADHALPARFRLYDRLFTDPAPDTLDDFLTVLNPASLVETEGWVEPGVADDPADTRYQFERLGYFWRDPEDSGTVDASGAFVFNRIVALRDSWARQTATPATREAPPNAAPTAPSAAQTPRDPASALDAAQRERFDTYVERGAGAEEAAVLATDDALGSLFEAVLSLHEAPREAAVLLVQTLRPALPEGGAHRASPGSLADVLRMADAGTLTPAGVREAVAALAAEGGTAESVVDTHGLAAVRGADALRPAVDDTLAAHPDEVARYRAGDARLFGFLTGQAMRRAGKGADAQAVQAMLRDALG